jgi:hypothetical protein
MPVSIHAFHHLAPLHNTVLHDGFSCRQCRYPPQFGDEMDNIPLQIGFDGHYVV